MSRMCGPGAKSAKPMTSSVARRPPGWMTRLPSTARNAYGSSRATSERAVWLMGAVGIAALLADGRMARVGRGSVAERGGAFVSDPLPHRDGAAEFGVLE